MNEEDILAIQKRLEFASERLNEAIKKEEEYYQSLNLGVEAFIRTKSSFDLGYTRNGKDWKIVVKQETTDIKNPWIKWDLDRAPRGIRYAALKYFPELREAIFASAESLANRIEKALKGEDE